MPRPLCVAASEGLLLQSDERVLLVRFAGKRVVVTALGLLLLGVAFVGLALLVLVIVLATTESYLLVMVYY